MNCALQLCFDTPKWISEVLHFCHGLPVILVACKRDLREDPKTIDDLRRLGQRPVQKAEVRDSKRWLVSALTVSPRVWRWHKKSGRKVTWNAALERERVFVRFFKRRRGKR